MSDAVRVYEVGPRDGLQNERAIISTAKKIGLVDRLSRAGLSKIEVTSFVSPKWVPQLADAAEVMSGITRHTGVDYGVLAPNLIGAERAIAAGADELAIFGSATEGFSRKNINCSIEESLLRFEPVMRAASAASVPVRGYISCVVHCPYDGAVDPRAVRDVALHLHDMGCYEIALGDTTGAGTPESVRAMIEAVLEVVPADRLAGHFHDTNGMALDNVTVALELGLRTFDSAIGGLGGCPYAPGAKGNLSTSALVDLLTAQGFRTGIDADALAIAEAFLGSISEQPAPLRREILQ